MDAIVDWVLKGLLVLLGLFVHRILSWWKLRKIFPVWKPFTSGEDPLAIILSTRPGPHARSTPRISFNEMLSFSELSQLCSRVHRQIQPLPSDVDVELLKSRDLVILGGPLINPIAEIVWRLVQHDIPICFNSDTSGFVSQGKDYVAEYAADGTVMRDYGVVVRCKSPLLQGDGRHVMLCFGIHGYGSRGALCSVMQGHIARSIGTLAHGGDFVALIEVAVKGHAVLRTDLIHCYPLKREMKHMVDHTEQA